MKKYIVVLIVFGLLVVLYKMYSFYESLKIYKTESILQDIKKEFPDLQTQELLYDIYNRDYENAVKKINKNPKILETLSVDGGSVLNYVIWHANSVEDVNVLLAAGANPNLPANTSALAVAAGLGNTQICKALLDAGANPNRNFNTETVLENAVMSGSKETVLLLLENKADINIQNENGETPLVVAIQSVQYEIAAILLQKGASPFVVNERGETAAYWLNRDSRNTPGKQHLIEMLKNKGVTWPPQDPKKILRLQKEGKWPK